MNICVLALAHNVRDGRVFHRQAKALKQAGHSVSVIARGNTRAFATREMDDGINILALSKRPKLMLLRFFHDLWIFLVMLGIAVRRSSRVDVFYCHEYQSLLIGWLVARFSRKKVVYDCHEYQPESIAMLVDIVFPGAVRLAHLAQVLFAVHERFIARHLDAVVTAHPGIATMENDLEQRFRRYCSKVVAVPNYPSRIIMENLPEPSQEWRERIAGRDVIVFAGYLSENRGISVAVRMLKHISDRRARVCLFLVGGFSVAYARNIDRLSHDLGVHDKIVMTGQVDYTVLLSLLSLAKIGLNLIQHKVGQNHLIEPTKIYQYAAAGIPIVNSDLLASRAAVETLQNGIIVPASDSLAAADAVLELLSDETKCRELGNRGRKAFLSKYNAEAVSPRLTEMIQSLS